jgi:hypothetical protein
MEQPELAVIVAATAGAIISLLTTYVPKFNEWYASQTSQIKALLQLAFNLIGALVLLGLSCAQFTTVVTCDVVGLKQLAFVFVIMLLGNQTAFTLTPTRKPKE